MFSPFRLEILLKCFCFLSQATYLERDKNQAALHWPRRSVGTNLVELSATFVTSQRPGVLNCVVFHNTFLILNFSSEEQEQETKSWLL